jgi:hypothetical protein
MKCQSRVSVCLFVCLLLVRLHVCVVHLSARDACTVDPRRPAHEPTNQHPRSAMPFFPVTIGISLTNFLSQIYFLDLPPAQLARMQTRQAIEYIKILSRAR